MKYCLVAILSVTGIFSVHGQVNTQDNVAANWPPKIYVNAVAVSSVNYINVSNIVDIQMGKGAQSGIDITHHTNGVLYLKLKNPNGLVSLSDLLRQQNISEKGRCVFVINDEVLLDTVNVRIDRDAIKKINVIKPADVKYLSPGAGVMIFNIRTIGQTPTPPDPRTLKIQ